ncbi:multiple inositol polyphosphate phosphatase 1-like [Phymastichus coffea]|uniref:multiple inositol polyphosphate phosphatase 1-like n=1 Tax=Phymastichus coffea TaxID=108790 RepID=UPI00273C7600|nr:multiple inositol polyphosphate phosphatase 1-like [Phymastichus coffea]
MLIRHGTRYPSQSEIQKFFKLADIRDDIIKNHKNGAGNLSSTILKQLSDWRLNPDMTIESAYKLTSQGKQDMYQLARRLRNIFPELLQVDPKKVKHGDFVFRATNTERTQSSLAAFTEGIFGTSEEIVPPEKPPTNDTLLLAYKNCPAWEKHYWEDHYDRESNQFAVGPEVEKLLRQVTRRLGYNQTLDYDVARTLYNICRFETAWQPQNLSSWCYLFTNDELKIFEYQEDLDHYYYCGPGRQWNADLGCQPLKDMHAHFKEIIDGNSKNHAKGVFYFAHTVTIETVMAALGFDGGSSKPLLAANYSSSQDRKYRTSLLGPFATNIIAVLYNCAGSMTPYTVSFYVAENLERIENCYNGLCDWSFIDQKLSQHVNNCSLNFC